MQLLHLVGLISQLQSVIKVKPCSALLCMLLLCIHSYLKSVLRYKFLVLDAYHPDTVYLLSKVVRVHGILKLKRASKQKNLGNTAQ